MSGIRFAIAWSLVVLVFWFGLFLPSTRSGEIRFVAVDLEGYFYPKFLYGIGELASGRLPLWNPYEYAGLPFLAAAQPATLYPPWLLVHPLPGPLAYQAFMVLHYLAAGPIAYVALRGLGSGVAGAALGAVVATFNPVVMDRNYHPNQFSALIWVLPVLAAALATIARPGPKPALVLGVALSLELLAGYPEFVLDTVILALPLVSIRLVEVARADGLAAARRAIIWLLAASLLFLLLTALQWLPLLEMQGQSYRAAAIDTPMPAFRVRAQALGGGPAGWLTAAAEVFHLPALAWLCVIAALAARRTNVARHAAETWTWALVAVIPPLLLLLVPGPLHNVFPFRYFRANVCWNGLFYMPVAVLAARGLDACLSPTPPWRHTAGVVTLVGAVGLSAPFLTLRAIVWLILGIAALVAACTTRRPAVASAGLATVVGTALLSVWTWIPATISGGPYLHRYSRGEHRLPYPPESLIAEGQHVAALCRASPGRLLDSRLAYNGAGLLAHIRLVNGYPESLAPARMRRVLGACGVPAHRYTIDFGLLSTCAPWLDRLDVGCARFDPGHDAELAGAGFAPAANDRGVPIYHRVSPGRIRLVEGAVFAGSADHAFALVSSGTLDPRSTVVVERGGEVDTSAAADAAPGRARILRDELAGEIVLEVEAERAGYLVLSEAYYPGWRATVDGVATPVHRADFAVMAIQVPPGRHSVRFWYAPLSARVGGWLSLAGLIALAAVAAAVHGGRFAVDGASQSAHDRKMT